MDRWKSFESCSRLLPWRDLRESLGIQQVGVDGGRIFAYGMDEMVYQMSGQHYVFRLTFLVS